MVTLIKADEPVKEGNNLNYMPCLIKFNGTAKVSAYFEPSEECDGVKQASFRGRPLHGSAVDLPKGFTGYVLKQPDGSICTQRRVYHVEQTFKKMNYWNLDRLPSQNDTLMSAFDWIAVSEALHSHSAMGENVKSEDVGIDEE